MKKIFIRQDLRIENEINRLCEQNGKIPIEIDLDSVDNAIERVKEKSKGNRSIRKNADRIIKYLNKIKKMNIKFNQEIYCENDKILTRPIQCIDIKGLSIKTSDFFLADSYMRIDVSISDVLNAIAVELAYRDCDYECDSIDAVNDVLADYNILEEYDGAELLEKFDTRYESMKGCKISDTEYRDTDGKCIDYYLGDCGRSMYYTDMLESSARKTVSMILSTIVDNLNRYAPKIVAVYEDSFVIYIDQEFENEINEIVDEIDTDIVVRVLGRKWAFKPKYRIY